MELNEIIQQRRAKLEAFKEKGICAYPSISASRKDIAVVDSRRFT